MEVEFTQKENFSFTNDSLILLQRISTLNQQLQETSSLKHDLARSCFQLWSKIGDEGDKISRKKTGEALAETVFSRNFVSFEVDFEGHN